MTTLTYILLFTFLSSIGALIGGLLLISNKNIALKLSHFLASFAAGVLIGSAFFDLLPEALLESEGMNINVFLWVVVGLLIFFLIERYVHSFHHHEKHPHEDQIESKTTIPLIIISDTIHNFIDGVVIAATFLADTTLGMITTLAVASHEIPQEIGDFGLLLHKGLSRGKVILVNVLSASVAILGAVITFFLGGFLENYLPALLGLTAGFFIYIAASDLIPEIHHEKRRTFAILQSLSLILGIVLVWFSVSLLEHPV